MTLILGGRFAHPMEGWKKVQVVELATNLNWKMILSNWIEDKPPTVTIWCGLSAEFKANNTTYIDRQWLQLIQCGVIEIEI